MNLAMTEPADYELVLYGLDDKAKPRAGLIDSAEAEAARALACSLTFQLMPISTAQRRVLAAELTPANLADKGYSAVPIIRRPLFTEIERAAQVEDSAQEPGPGREAPAPSGADEETTLWDRIKVGQLVLAQEDNPKHGWWEAIVLNELGGGDVLLRYRDYPTQGKVVRHRDQLALLKST